MIMSASLSVLPFGGCLLHGPLNPVARSAADFRYPKYGPIPGVYTFGEMHQVIEVLRGQRNIPGYIRPLCGMSSNFRAVPGTAEFSDVDVALLEPSSPIDLVFRGCYLNRSGLAMHVAHPLRALGRQPAKHANLWVRTGLIGLNEKVRAEAAEELITYIPKNMENANCIKAVILETRSVRSDIRTGFLRMRELIRRPIGVVVYIFQYLADGRAVSWPAGFHEEIAEVARQLDLPTFDPSTVVREYGVGAALRDDFRHYNAGFMPVMAKHLAAFARSVFDKSWALAAE